MKSVWIFQIVALCAFTVEALGQSPTNWVVRKPYPPAGELGEITFYDGRFILADRSGGMLTSSDGGQTWTRASGPAAPLKIVYAEGKYVAITEEQGFGQDKRGEIYTSIDGQTWTLRWQTIDIRDLLYANGLFIAVAEDGILTSADGVNWTEPANFWGWALEDVAFGNGAYVVVGTHQNLASPMVLRSTNAVDWTQHLPPGGALVDVTFGNGLFVANGGGGEFLTSSDGVEWAAHPGVLEPPLFPPIAIVALGFGNGHFVASSGNYIYYSTDGTNWTIGCLRCDSPSDRARFPANSIAFGAGRFITANRDSTMFTSTDARNWSILRYGGDIHAVTHGAGKFVAAGAGSAVWSSFDGSEWTYAFAQAKGNLIPPDLYGVAYGENLFVTVGSFGAIATSPDALTWTQQEEETIGGIEETFRAVAYGSSIFVAAGERRVGPGATTAPTIVVSSNGSNWTYATFTANSTAFHGVGYGNGTFVVVGTQGAIVTSTDGNNWTARTSGTSQTLRAVTYHNGRFLVAGDSGAVVTSTDGVNWGPSSPTSFANRGLASGNGVIAVGNVQNDGRLHYSNDGLGWPGTSTSFPEILNGVAYGNGSWIVVGNNGFIVQGTSVEIRLSNPRRTQTAFEMLIHRQGQVSSYRVQGSSNLRDWQTLLTLISPPSTYLYRDDTASTAPFRYYRVVAP